MRSDCNEGERKGAEREGASVGVEGQAHRPRAHVPLPLRSGLESRLEAVKLSGLAAPLWSAIEKLRDQSAATGAALNAKFAAEGDAFKGEMGFGGVEQFYGGVLHDSSLPILPALSHADNPHRPLSRPREAHRAAAHGGRLALQGHGDGALRREGCGSAV